MAAVFYGECIAYAGGIENQGSALLHTHLLFLV
jgi:hypothetical protein